MGGWLRLYRKVKEWEWYTESYMVHLFIHLLIDAHYEDTRYKGINYKRGQVSIGRKKLSLQTGISEQKIRTGIERLRDSGEITTKTTSKFTIVTICNYDQYQCDQPPQQPALQPADNQQVTSKQPADNQQITTVKEVKKLKEVKEVKNINSVPANSIFVFWNSKGIIVHKNIKPFQQHINAKLEDGYSEEEIKEAIENYSTVLFGGQYFWTHKYGLKDFLTRAGNLDRFLSANSPLDSFRNKEAPQHAMQPRNLREAQSVQCGEIAKILLKEREDDRNRDSEESGLLLEHKV
jgi:hypothetical protein